MKILKALDLYMDANNHLYNASLEARYEGISKKLIKKINAQMIVLEKSFHIANTLFEYINQGKR